MLKAPSRPVLAFAAALAVVGLGAGGFALASSGGSSADPQEQALTDAANAFYNAMVTGNSVAVAAYFRDGECDDQASQSATAAALAEKTMKGISLEVTKVKVSGSDGTVFNGKAHGDVSDAARRLTGSETKDTTEPTGPNWHLVDGKWYVNCGTSEDTKPSFN